MFSEEKTATHLCELIIFPYSSHDMELQSDSNSIPLLLHRTEIQKQYNISKMWNYPTYSSVNLNELSVHSDVQVFLLIKT